MLQGIFVTGTDTGVGKTLASVAIIQALADLGFDVGAMKAVECGPAVAPGADADVLAAAAGTLEVDASTDICPYRFADPLAPAVAALLAGVTIDPAAIATSYGRLTRAHRVVVVEGAGGALVPVTESESIADLAARLCAVAPLAVVVVARLGLGTINHTLLTLEALRRRDLRVAGVVFNGLDEAKAGLAERTNPDIIARISGIPLLGILPHVGSLAASQDWLGAVRRQVTPHLDRALLHELVAS